VGGRKSKSVQGECNIFKSALFLSDQPFRHRMMLAELHSELGQELSGKNVSSEGIISISVERRKERLSRMGLWRKGYQSNIRLNRRGRCFGGSPRG